MSNNTCRRQFREYILRLSLYRRHPLDKRACCRAQVMAEMREVGKMRRILYKARSRKRWLFSTSPHGGANAGPQAGSHALDRSCNGISRWDLITC